MKRKSLEGHPCSIARSLDVIGDWWSLLIVRDAISGLTRFGEFQKSLGMAKNILSIRLKSLVDNDIMEIVPASDGSAYQEYKLTDKGRALLPVLIALGQWGGEYLYNAEELGLIPVDNKKKQPLKKIELRSSEGKLLKPAEVYFPREKISI